MKKKKKETLNLKDVIDDQRSQIDVKDQEITDREKKIFQLKKKT